MDRKKLQEMIKEKEDLIQKTWNIHQQLIGQRGLLIGLIKELDNGESGE